MKQFIGTKVINATPMNRADYNALRGIPFQSGSTGEPGYLVEYTDGGSPNVEGFKGYVSWSPKEQFEAAYRQTDGLPFGLAIEAMKKGLRVARSGWNGKGMWVSMTHGQIDLPAGKFWNENNRKHAERLGGYATVLPCFTMKTASGEILMGWLASQTDMLADDWVIVADPEPPTFHTEDPDHAE